MISISQMFSTIMKYTTRILQNITFIHCSSYKLQVITPFIDLLHLFIVLVLLVISVLMLT